MSAPYILVVDDERDIRELVKDILQDEGYEVSLAANGEEARRLRLQRRPNLILLDVWMPDVDGISLLREWGDEAGPDIPVIMISGHGTVETAVEATRLGAYDFIEKPLSLAKLLLVVTRALEADRLQRENIGLRRKAQPLGEPVGGSKMIRELCERVQRIARHNAWVLISGEAGSGKELFARYLHASSSRADGPFIDVSVASMATTNAAVELFGSEEGGSVYYGCLEQANGGTLFLSEVGDMDPGVQAKLFSTLENKSFLRVGGVEPVTFDVRIVAATHRDLRQDVVAGRFREDLYYHLNVVPLHIPPLREHAEDVKALLDYYAEQFARREGLSQCRFSEAAVASLVSYDWPGNVRELKNLVQRLMIFSSEGEVSLAEVESALGGAAKKETAQHPLEFDLPLRGARQQFEKAYFEYQLRELQGNLGQIARKAGIERTHLYRKFRALGIDKKKENKGK